ncbi:MAG TPA: EAL domain-containing protein [Xanthobacteraceae bacterium]
MDAVESDAGTTNAPAGERPRAERKSDRYHSVFRRQLGAVAIGLLTLNLALGLFARQQQHAIIGYALGVYDTAFVSTNYLHLAQMSFQRYLDERIRAADASQIAHANARLETVLDEMDVAIERSSSSRSRAEGLDIRENIAALRGVGAGDAQLADRMADIQTAMERLSARNADVGLKARDDVEEFSVKSDFFLLGSIATSIMLAALALMVLNRMINSLKQRSSAQLSGALEGMPQGLSMFDADQRLIVCNANYAAMYGLRAEHTEPGTPLQAILEHRVTTGTAPLNVEDFVAETLGSASQSHLGVTEQVLDDGRVISVINAPLSTGGEVTIHMDVTEKRNSERQIAFLAHHDALTGLANRVQLREHIEQSLKRSERGEKFSVLCLDLDHFKDINDTLGHSVGDALLSAVAKRLRELVREGDLVSRTGGDEFSIVQADTEAPMAASAALAARVVEALGVPFELGDHQVVVGASVGIAIAPDDGSDADQLLKNADMALYRAKDDGRGGFHFFEREMDAEAQARRMLELDLRKAIAAAEFEVFFQPIVNLKENNVSGFEALLRWNHPVRGRVSPDAFIPLAEETGLIVQIGDWVIRQACAEAAKWPSNLRVAVNVSPVQFRHKGLVSSVMSALAASGVRSDRLELEITEAVLMHNNETTLAALHQMRSLGVRISMDDFGTGYSSLSYLRSFPFDKIKIDQTFIRDLIERPDSIAIIRAVAGLGQSFGMTTTAEGVETKEQLDQMRAEGCTEVQGYFYSKPIPAAEIPQLLEGFGKRNRAAA